jgi:hypothetical protein
LAKLEKDKSGLLLKECLNAVAKGTLAAEDLGRLIVSKASLSIIFVQLLPKILTGAHEAVVLRILEGLLKNLLSFTEEDRTKVSAALAVLGSQLLTKKKRKPGEDQTFTLLCSAMQEILKSSTESRKGIWLFVDTAQVESKGSKVNQNDLVTIHGASFVVEILQQQITDPKVRESVVTLAFNLGIRPIGSQGETASFDPSLHEDTVGGLFRNDQVTILMPGWSLGSHALTRAKVKGIDA